MGLIIRSAAAAADLEEIGEDIQTMRATAEAIAAEIGQTPRFCSRAMIHMCRLGANGRM